MDRNDRLLHFRERADFCQRRAEGLSEKWSDMWLGLAQQYRRLAALENSDVEDAERVLHEIVMGAFGAALKPPRA